MAEEEQARKKSDKQQVKKFERIVARLPPDILDTMKRAVEIQKAIGDTFLPVLLASRAMNENVRQVMKDAAEMSRIAQAVTMATSIDLPIAVRAPRSDEIQLDRIEAKQDQILKLVNEIYALWNGEQSEETRKKLRKLWDEAKGLIYR